MISVTYVGLCMHVAPVWEITEVTDDQTEMPKVECHVCNKKWIYSKEAKKFVEIK